MRLPRVFERFWRIVRNEFLIDENLPHQPRGQSKKMRAAHDGHAFETSELEIRFVDEASDMDH